MNDVQEVSLVSEYSDGAMMNFDSAESAPFLLRILLDLTFSGNGLISFLIR